MRTRTVQEHIGENMGPVDWSYDFWPHFGGYCCNDDVKREMMEARIQSLFELVQRFNRGEQLQVRDGDSWWDVLEVGMYDGWPYWRPVPSVCIYRVFGPEWEQFPHYLNGIRAKKIVKETKIDGFGN